MVNSTIHNIPPPPFLPPDEQTRRDFTAQQVKIQAALFVTFVICTMILVLGRLRSRGNGFMKLISTYSFMIAAFSLTYIPGLMNGPNVSNDLYIFWIVFIAYLAAVTNEISCYTLGDNEDRKKRLIVEYTVAWPLIISSLHKSLAAPEVLVPIVLILWVIVLKLRERSRALMFSTNTSNGLARSSKVVVDFTNYHNNATDKAVEADETNAPSYENILVGVSEANETVTLQPQTLASALINFDPKKVITLGRVMNSQDEFLAKTNEGKELQNICFSFSMFWLLLAKIAGHDNVDAVMFKDGKLPSQTFDLVERELEFLYDYLFTNYYVIYERGFWKKFRDVCIVCLFLWLTIPLLVEYRPQDHSLLYVILWGSVLDTGFTRFVIVAIIIIEFTQIGIFLTSKWAKVMFTVAYLRNHTPWGTRGSAPSNLLQRVITIVCRIPRPRLSFFGFKSVTTRKIGQYSILKSYNAIPTLVWFKCWIGSYIDLPRMGQAGSSTVDLTQPIQDEILKSVENCLAKHGGKFTNGIASLQNNNVEADIVHEYVKKLKSQARVILVWHIATSLLEDKNVGREEPSASLDFEMATKISNYCAYLIAFIPRMLPDHVFATQCEFDAVVRELEIEIGVHDEDDEDQEDPKELYTGDYSIRKEGRMLKKRLKKQENLWRILAEFWTELLMFLALSDHGDAIEAHANNLCVGGQFITHLWAILTHAGCSRDLSCLNQ